MEIQHIPSDLIIHSDSIDKWSLTPDQSFNYFAIVLNQGDGLALASDINVYLSNDSAISPADTPLGTKAINPLQPGQFSNEQNWGLWAPSDEGTYWIGSCVSGDPGEGDTTNNCSDGLSITVSDSTAPDLVVESPQVSTTTLTPGQNFTASATVRNQGTATSASTTLRYKYSTKSTIDASDQNIGSDPVSSLASGSTSPESASVSIAQTGAFWVGACVDPVAGEPSTTNNCSAGVQVTVSEPTAPDLLVESPEVSTTTLTPGQSFTASATVRNQGTATSASTTLRYKYSTNSTIDASDQNIGSDPVSSLASGSTSPESASVSIAQTGTFWVGACVDPVAGESSTANNCSAGVQVTISEPTAPDLLVESPEVSTTTLTPGQSFTASATVRNQGTATSASTTLRYKYSTNSTIDASDQNIGSDPVSSLASGATSPESASVSIAQTGTFWVGACVDPVAGESSTTNNCSDGVRVRSEGPDDHFVTTWQTDNPGVSGPTQITIPMVSGPYDVDWDNDGVFDQTGLTGPVTHDFGAAGTYTVRIKGFYSSIQFDNSGDAEKILRIDQWGTGSWQSMARAFYGAENLQIPASDTPDFAAVTDMFAMFKDTLLADPDTSSWNTSAVQGMGSMFSRAISANPDTSGWDTSSVRSMSRMFAGAPLANPDTSSWDTSSVQHMRGMFSTAVSANPDTSGWDTSAVTSMVRMFRAATSANPDTSNWDTSSVTDMWGMFSGATAANPDTSGWDTSSVTDMSSMFSHTTAAKPDTSGWDTSSVTDMFSMFLSATSANPNTSGWDTSAVTRMTQMFDNATSADPDTSSWNTSAVENMTNMFRGTTSANPDTSSWDTSSVTNMRSMFSRATSASPDTSGWDTSSVTDMSSMFSDATLANPDTSAWDTSVVTDMGFMFFRADVANPDASSWNVQSLADASGMFEESDLTTANYEGLLEAWSAQALQPNVPFGASSNYYCSDTAVAARTQLTDANQWTITDLGRGCSVSGQVSGLQGSGLTLQLNGGNDLAVAADGAFAFPGSLDNQAAYTVTVSVQPTNLSQTCSVANGTGTVTGPNVTDVQVSCETNEFTVGGAVSGLSGTGLVLQNNSGDNQTIAANGPLAFTAQDDGTAYNVTVLTQPTGPSQTCTVSNGSGTVSGANITDVQVNCQTGTHTVTAQSEGNGSITPFEQIVAEGSSVGFTLTPESGHAVLSVLGDSCTPLAQGAGVWVADDITADCLVTASFTRNQASLHAFAMPATMLTGTTGALSASGGSGSGAVSFKVVSGAPSCSIAGTALHALAFGECTVVATKAGDGTFLPATAEVGVRVVDTLGVDLEIIIFPIDPIEVRQVAEPGCDPQAVAIEVLNRGPIDAPVVRLQALQPVGLIEPFAWSCLVDGGECQPAAGGASVDTEFALAVGAAAVVEWQGCADPAAAWADITASAGLGDEIEVVFPRDDSQRIFLPLNGDGLFRDGFE